MMYHLDPDFQRRLGEFNQSRGGPAFIAVAWDDKKRRWRIWAVPTSDSHHPLARNQVTNKMLRPIPDGSGRYGVPLNLWQGANGEYEPMDERLFEAIAYADSFGSRHHFEQTFKDPEIQKELSESKKRRDLVSASRSYWQKLDSITLSMNPSLKVGGDWRATKYWR